MARGETAVLTWVEPAQVVEDSAELLQILADRCVSLLSDVDAAAALFTDERGEARVLAAATEPAHLVAVRRLHDDHGPGRECLRTGRQFACPDLRAGDERWPRFAVTAARAGLRGAVALPARRYDTTIAAITLFSKGTSAPGDRELRIARALADAAAITVAQQRAVDHYRTAAQHLQRALDSRVIIEQAKGVLAGRRDLDVAAAFDAMRSYARSHNVELHELAREIVARGIDIPVSG
jgi:GAF domain-containing protein